MHPSIRAGWRRRSALAFYSLAAVAMWLLCLGPAPTFMGKPLLYKAPYAWLMLMPGVEGVRVPAQVLGARHAVPRGCGGASRWATSCSGWVRSARRWSPSWRA